ncbi:MAG TPA: class I SAM-dependent methyltransferase [Burkholderiaceae bacterium]|nr:class I SAM-dependent methyltransferase [Burkholderiaceae bacterium]
MDLIEYRRSAPERARVKDLMALVPKPVEFALDVGARDGFISRQLTRHSAWVTALDLEEPRIEHERIRCVQGDVTALSFSDASFDLVLCSEVLEHIPGRELHSACSELGRVAKRYILVGVPYKQDIRFGRTTCRSCGHANPPWGHVNRFDELRLKKLFPDFDVVKTTFVGSSDADTNFVSSALMDLAGNPYGTYSQDEPCTHCGSTLQPPPERHLWQKVFTRLAFLTRSVQKPFIKPHANWIHMLLKKRSRTH